MRFVTKTRLQALILAVAGAGMLSACASGGMFHHDAPNEFAVQRETPLVVPPDFALTPPRAGQPRPAERNLQEQTTDALFGNPAPRSQVESDAVSKAGTATPGIRSAVGDPETHTVNKGRVTRDILAAPQGDGKDAQVSAGA